MFSQAGVCAVWVFCSVCIYVTYYTVTGDINEADEFTKWAWIFRTAVYAAYGVYCKWFGAGYTALDVSATLGVTTVMAVDVVISIVCVYLFWADAWIVKTAFGLYSPILVLTFNFLAHYVPLMFDIWFVARFRLQMSVHFKSAVGVIFVPVITVITGSFVTLFFVIYAYTMTPENIYGVSMQFEQSVLPMLAVACIFTAWVVYFIASVT
jgi:hypothetical protein